jgi:hypothetical protein
VLFGFSDQRIVKPALLLFLFQTGSKFGGYGSFFQTHQWSPSVLLQPKTPAIMQNNSTKKLPNKPLVKVLLI